MSNRNFFCRYLEPHKFSFAMYSQHPLWQQRNEGEDQKSQTERRLVKRISVTCALRHLPLLAPLLLLAQPPLRRMLPTASQPAAPQRTQRTAI